MLSLRSSNLTLTWNIKVEGKIPPGDFRVVAADIFKEFGIKEKGIKENNQIITAHPRVFKWAFISPIDITLQHIKLHNQSEQGRVKIKFSFFKILVLSLPLLLIGSFTTPFLGLLFYAVSIGFFSFFALTSLYMYKDEIKTAIQKAARE